MVRISAAPAAAPAAAPPALSGGTEVAEKDTTSAEQTSEKESRRVRPCPSQPNTHFEASS